MKTEAKDIYNKLGVTAEAQAWMDTNQEYINDQYNAFLSLNGHGVIIGVDLANGRDYTVRDGVVTDGQTG